MKIDFFSNESFFYYPRLFFSLFLGLTICATAAASGFSPNENADQHDVGSPEKSWSDSEKSWQKKLARWERKMLRDSMRCRAGFDEEDNALSAVEVFRKYFHQGKYCKIPELKQRLIGEYLQLLAQYQATQDLAIKDKLIHTAKMIGLASAWTGAESGRDPQLGVLATDELITSNFYMGRAYELDLEDGTLDDSQVLGFFSGSSMGLARIHQDPEMILEASGLISLSIQTDPVFGLFAAVIGASRAPVESPVFQSAVDMILEYQDVCMNAQVDRENPDHTPYLPIEGGDFWSCPNTDRSLHRYEAFTIYAGDILTKAGRLDAAKVMYNNAMFSSSASRGNWKFWPLWKYRVSTDLEKLRDKFRSADDSDFIAKSKFQCMICHQK